MFLGGKQFDSVSRSETDSESLRTVADEHGAPQFFRVSSTYMKGQGLKAETKKVIRLLGRFLFVIYILALIYLLFLSEGYGRREFQNQDYRYNLVPFREICRFWRHRQAVGWMASFLNLGGNVIGFSR